MERAAGIAARVGPERAGAMLRSSQVAMAFEALGDRWSALMLREIFLGARRFEELVAATGASRATLTSRLRSLVDEGILHRHPYQARPTRYEYRLTRMGADLYPTALMYWLWEKRYGGSSPACRRNSCTGRAAHAMLPLLVCRACREPIDIGSIRVEIVAEPDERQVSLPKHCLHTGANSWREVEDGTVNVIDVIGDRWTALVQAAELLTACTGSRTSRRRCRCRPTRSRTGCACSFRRACFRGRRTRTARRGTHTGSPRKGARCTCRPSRCTNGRTAGCCADASRRSSWCIGRCGKAAEGAVVCDQCREELRSVRQSRPRRRRACRGVVVATPD